MPHIDDCCIVGEKPRDRCDRRNRRRQADPLRFFAAVLRDPRIESREGKRKVRSAFVVGERMDLIDDDRFDATQHPASAFGGEQDE